jgi:hypothetical protein
MTRAHGVRQTCIQDFEQRLEAEKMLWEYRSFMVLVSADSVRSLQGQAHSEKTFLLTM